MIQSIVSSITKNFPTDSLFPVVSKYLKITLIAGAALTLLALCITGIKGIKRRKWHTQPSHPFPSPYRALSPVSPAPPAFPSDTSLFSQAETVIAHIEKDILSDPNTSAVQACKTISQTLQHMTAHYMDEVIAEFERRNRNSTTQIFKAKAPLPAYFANVSDASQIISRKYLSLCGMRNLLYFGPEIIDELKKTHFLGGENNYSAGVGLKKLKDYTGTVLDLDIELSSDTSPEKALEEAKKHIVRFGQHCGLHETTAEGVSRALPKRKLHLPSNSWSIIDVGSHHTNRSMAGIWKRTPPHSPPHFYVNVPDMSIVVGGLLKLPYLIAELVHKTKQKEDPQLLKQFYDEFFETGLSDKCINDKLSSLVLFFHNWEGKLLPSPEESALEKVRKGAFGAAIQLDGQKAVDQAVDRNTFLNLLPDDLEVNKEPFDTWKMHAKEAIIKKLTSDGFLDKRLYCKVKNATSAEDRSDYFLLNEATVEGMLQETYNYIKSLE